MTFFFHQLKNFIQNDPLSDWYSLIHKKYKHFEEDNKSSFEEEIDEKKSKYKEDFFIFLKERQQYHFEFNLDHEQTNELITMKKIGIFINCSLYHKNYDILVKPDLIIHRDIFQEIFNQVNEDLPEYIVIDILYKIIHFNTDKTDILNQGNIFYHKCKMFIASLCINKSLKKGYLFAKEYRYKDKILPKKESIGTF